jgi:RNA polymerase sigma-70 factor (ECF subfamily)
LQSGQDKAVRSRDDIAKAVRELTPADWIRLRKSAAFWALGRPISAKDLLQEAFARAMDGRVCPADVGILKFLALTMRSIAHGEGEKVGNRLLLVSADASESVAQKVLDLHDPGAGAEQQMMSQETVTEIRSAILALFDDDATAQIIAEGLMDGIDGEELRVLCELDAIKYNSKRRLVRRRIEKAFPKGWQP